MALLVSRRLLCFAAFAFAKGTSERGGLEKSDEYGPNDSKCMQQRRSMAAPRRSACLSSPFQKCDIGFPRYLLSSFTPTGREFLVVMISRQAVPVVPEST